MGYLLDFASSAYSYFPGHRQMQEAIAVKEILAVSSADFVMQPRQLLKAAAVVVDGDVVAAGDVGGVVAAAVDVVVPITSRQLQ